MLDGTRNQPADAQLFQAPVPDIKRGSNFIGRDGLMTFATQIFGDIPANAEVRYWDNEAVRQRFRMYGDNTLYINEALIIGNDGFVAFIVPESFMDPHFTPETGELQFGEPEFDFERSITAVDSLLKVTPAHAENHFTPETEASYFQGHISK